jgi:hypothetical protein
MKFKLLTLNSFVLLIGLIFSNGIIAQQIEIKPVNREDQQLQRATDKVTRAEASVTKANQEIKMADKAAAEALPVFDQWQPLKKW